jgi:hypothetical protein
VLPTSELAVRWLCERVASGELANALRWARDRPQTLTGRLLLEHAPPGEREEDVFLTLLDLQQEVNARLAVLRVCATLASTLGLLGAILAIRAGLGAPEGLVRLQAGLAESLALSRALLTMAIGVATSAGCFYALALFRRAALTIITQGRRLAHALAAFEAGLATDREPKA